MSLEDLYKEIILDHYKHPRNLGSLDDPSIHEGGHNPSCGDKIDLFLSLDSDGVIRKVTFSGKGCSISQASASMLTEVLVGKTVSETEKLLEKVKAMLKGEFTPDDDDDDFEDLAALQGVAKFPVRIKCALLSWSALEAGLKSFSKETNN